MNATTSHTSRNVTGGVDQIHLDHRLVAAVQVNAGAHCHRVANLLQSYLFSVHLHRQAVETNSREEANAAMAIARASEIDLRKFLARARGSLGPWMS